MLNEDNIPEMSDSTSSIRLEALPVDSASPRRVVTEVLGVLANRAGRLPAGAVAGVLADLVAAASGVRMTAGVWLASSSAGARGSGDIMGVAIVATSGVVEPVWAGVASVLARARAPPRLPMTGLSAVMSMSSSSSSSSCSASNAASTSSRGMADATGVGNAEGLKSAVAAEGVSGSA